MPTGYTYDIKEGISFEDFVLNCAKSFCCKMRDLPLDTQLPEKFEPSDYHKKEYEQLLNFWVNSSKERINEEVKKIYNRDVKKYKEVIKERNELRIKYENMLKLVNNWIPPSAAHEDLKNFMIYQITDSIKIDCTKKYLYKPELQTGEEYKQMKIKMIKDDIEYHKKEYEKEVKEINRSNLFLKQLRGNL